MRNRRIPVVLYDTALNSAAYGNTAVMGDLFGDVMSAVVGKDNWDARPDWMKKVKIKADPAKIVKAVPPKVIGIVAKQAEKVGVNVFYKTPTGDMQITPDMAEGAWSNFPAFARASNMLGSIPSWVIMAGGVGLFVLIFLQGRRR
jgi:hypothetical protein